MKLLPVSIFSILFFSTGLLSSCSSSKALEPNFTSDPAKFSVYFPTPPQEQRKDTENAKLWIFSAADGDIGYTVRARDYGSVLPPENMPKFMNVLKESRSKGGNIETEKEITFANHKGLEVKFISQQGANAYMRIFNNKSVWYTLLVYSLEKYPPLDKANQFFESFKFK